MSDDADPPRKHYALKPKAFEAVNPVPLSAAGSRQEPAPEVPPAAVAPGKIDVRDLYASAAARSPGRLLAAPGELRRGTENDVHAMLRENHARANAAGLNELAPQGRRKSKRKRDYLVTMLVANPPIWALFAFALYYRNPYLLAYAGGGIVLFNVSFTWVMWFVIDDY